MIRRLSILLLIINGCFSCAPKISTSLFSRQKPLPDTAIIAIVMVNEPFEKQGQLVGTVAAGDNGLTSRCSYHQMISLLKAQAQASGANLIKITEHREPDAFSNCHRLRATLYLVEDPRRFEREITWSKWRKLTWEDFKGIPDTTQGEPAGVHTVCGFGFQASRRIGGKTRISAQNTFDCLKSWVKPERSGNEELLRHQQKHFDLSEIYARKLRQRLSEPNLSIYGFSDASAAIFNEVLNEYNARLRAYDEETRHGALGEMQEKWNRMIEEELLAGEKE